MILQFQTTNTEMPSPAEVKAIYSRVAQADERGDHKTSLKLMRQLGERGHGYTQYLLGLRYDEGIDVSVDYAEALKWYLLAADYGISGAKYELGVMYSDGRGVKKNLKRAVKWFKRFGEEPCTCPNCTEMKCTEC